MSPSKLSQSPRLAPRATGQTARLFLPGCITLAATELYFATHAEVQSPVHLQLGLLMIFFAFLPLLLWSKRGKTSLPVFEVFLFTGINTYAFPLLSGHAELVHYTVDEITSAALAVVAFQGTAIAAYEFTRGRPSNRSFWRNEIISQDVGRWLNYGLALNTLYLALATFTTLIPDSLVSVLRAIFFGIGIVCTFITSRRLGAGKLGSVETIFFLTNLVLQCIAMISTLYLVGTVSVLLLALVGYVSSSGRIPLVTVVVAVGVLAVLHNGKSAMRTKYWDNEATPPSFAQLPSFLAEWFEQGLQRNEESTAKQKMTNKLIERTSLFHLMCLVVSLTPTQQPYLEGETYKDIPAQFVPRLFWPDKPLGHVSTSRLSVYYGLQTDEDTQKTTIGFGMVTEAYANFGYFGLIGLASLLGFALKKVQGLGEQAPLFSYGGLILVVLLAWSFQVEFTLSIWLASLYQASVAVLLIPFLLRKAIG